MMEEDQVMLAKFAYSMTYCPYERIQLQIKMYRAAAASASCQLDEGIS